MTACLHGPVIHARRSAVNPQRIDPTRTAMIRKSFIADLTRRLVALRKHVREFLIKEDALGLGEKKNPFLINATYRQYQFLTDEGKLKAFNEWFKQQVEADVFSVPPGTPFGEPWTAKYVESAYRKGIVNAWLASHAAALAADGTLEAFIRAAFGRPERLSKARLLGTMVFENLQGITADMGAKLNRILAQGIIDGRSVHALAKEMSDTIGGLSTQRAFLIAHTEIIRAHAEGQLDSFTDLGIEELGILAEWSTVRDDRVCPLCAEMEGKTFTIEAARGLIPLHPRCRCAWTVAIKSTK
jgi:SPP1 gp7 family putative phage head morphogenesis protein